MTGVWLISYLVLWILFVVQALVVLALAREIETLRTSCAPSRDQSLPADQSSGSATPLAQATPGNP